MKSEKLTYKNVKTRAVLIPLKRPVVSRVGLFKEWPLILIDLETTEGVVGCSYLEPYLSQSVQYIMPVIHNLAAALEGTTISPVDNFQVNRK